MRPLLSLGPYLLVFTSTGTVVSWIGGSSSVAFAHTFSTGADSDKRLWNSYLRLKSQIYPSWGFRIRGKLNKSG